MKEHKTCSNWPEEKFDAEVNALVSDGWTVDSKAFGLNDDGGLYVAFLSREVAESPPIPKTVEDPIDLSELFHNGMMVIGMAAWKEIKAKADAWDTYSPALQKSGYSEADMHGAFHEGMNCQYAKQGRKFQDSAETQEFEEAHFGKFLDALKPSESRERPPDELLWEFYKLAYMDGMGQSVFHEDLARLDFQKAARNLPPTQWEADIDTITLFRKHILVSNGAGTDNAHLVMEALDRLCGKGESNG